MTVNASQATRQLDRLNRSANATGTSLARSFTKAGGAVAAVSGALGGINPQISVIGQGLSALAGGPVALAVAGFGTLVAAGVKLYDTLTVSASEFAAQCDVVSVKIAEDGRKLAEYDQTAYRLASRLQELNAVEKAGTESKRASAAMLTVLEKNYGALGASVDETTGKIRNLAEAEARLNQARARRKSEQLSAEADNAGSQAEAAFMKIKGAEWFTTEAGAGEKFREMRKTMSPDQLIAEMEARSRKATSEEEIRGYADVAKHLRAEQEQRRKAGNLRKTGYEDEADAAESLAGKRIAAEASEKNLREAERRNRIAESDREYQREPDMGKKAENRLALYQEEQKRRDEARREELSARSELRNLDSKEGLSGQAKDEARADLERQIAEAAAKAAEANGRMAVYWNQYKDAVYASGKEFAEQVRASRQQLAYSRLLADGKYEEAEAAKLEYEFREKGLTLTKEQRGELLRLRKANQAEESRSRIRDAEEEVRLQKLLAAGKIEEYRAEKLASEARKAGRPLSGGEKDRILAAQNALDAVSAKERVRDAEEELRIRKLILERKYKEAEAAKLEAEARKAGRTLSPEEKKARLSAAQEGKRLDLQQSLREQAESLYGQAMRANGRGSAYELDKALRDAEKQKNGKLNAEEEKSVRALFSLTERLKDVQTAPGVRGMGEIKTNALTARGGFSGAVRMPDTDRYNREISQNGRRQAELLREIRDLCEKLGRF